MTFLFFVVQLVEAGYMPVGGHDGVAVYLRKDAAVIDLAAVGEIDASPEAVQAALLDYEDQPRFNKHLLESHVVSRRPGELHVYQRLRLPVVEDRDYTLRVTWRDGVAAGLRFAIDNESGPPPTKRAIRMRLLEGRWQLEAIRGGRATRAVYHVRLDLAGRLPRSMVRDGSAKDVPNIFVGFRRALAGRR